MTEYINWGYGEVQNNFHRYCTSLKVGPGRKWMFKPPISYDLAPKHNRCQCVCEFTYFYVAVTVSRVYIALIK